MGGPQTERPKQIPSRYGSKHVALPPFQRILQWNQLIVLNSKNTQGNGQMPSIFLAVYCSLTFLHHLLSSPSLCKLMSWIFLELYVTYWEQWRRPTKPLNQQPTYAATMKKITDENGEKVDQAQLLKEYTKAEPIWNRYQEYCTCATAHIHTRLAWSDLQLFHYIIFMLGTQGWQKTLD